MSGEVQVLSEEAAAIVAGFVHLPTDQHAFIFASDEAWNELQKAFPERLFVERARKDEDFFQELT
jgi:hypothetical protein